MKIKRSFSATRERIFNYYNMISPAFRLAARMPVSIFGPGIAAGANVSELYLVAKVGNDDSFIMIVYALILHIVYGAYVVSAT